MNTTKYCKTHPKSKKCKKTTTRSDTLKTTINKIVGFRTDYQCNQVDTGKYCCEDTLDMKYIDGKMMCLSSKGNYPAIYESKQKDIDYNPNHHVPFVKGMMIAMYITIVLCISTFVYFLFNVILSLISLLLGLFILTLLASSMCGLRTFSKGVDKRGDLGLFDACSPAHLLRDMLFILIPYYFGVPFVWCCIIDLTFTIGYEIFESQIVERYWYNYGAESIKNRLTDIFISVMAIFITWGLLSILP